MSTNAPYAQRHTEMCIYNASNDTCSVVHVAVYSIASSVNHCVCVGKLLAFITIASFTGNNGLSLPLPSGFRHIIKS